MLHLYSISPVNYKTLGYTTATSELNNDWLEFRTIQERVML